MSIEDVSCSICKLSRKPFGCEGCNEIHKICRSCYEGYYNHNINNKPCFDCLNKSNIYQERVYCSNKPCLSQPSVLLCPEHHFCKCIQKCQSIKNIECASCLCLVKNFCVNCFSFKENTLHMHEAHYSCQDCRRNHLTKNIVCYKCRELLTKNPNDDFSDPNEESKERNPGIIEENKIKSNSIENYLESSKNVVINQVCSLCGKENGIASDTLCELNHLVCTKCQGSGFVPDQSKKFCFKCLNLWYKYDHTTPCNTCNKQESSIILCEKHSYCPCLKYNPKSIKCRNCAKLLEFFCYNCFEFKKCEKIHENHYLCNSCKSNLTLLILDCTDCASILRPVTHEKEKKTSNFNNNAKCFKSQNQDSAKCSLCKSTPKKLDDWKCEDGNSVCLECSQGKFIPQSEEFCIKCLNGYYSDLESSSKFSCFSCNSLDKQLVRFCAAHVFCDCIQTFSRPFEDLQCRNCEKLMIFFCFGCFKFNLKTKKIDKKHYLCINCENSSKTNNNLQLKSSKFAESLINNPNWTSKPVSTPTFSSNLLPNSGVTFPINQALVNSGTFSYSGQTSYPSNINPNYLRDFLCPKHLINYFTTFDCSHPQCMQCLIIYLIKKFLRFLIKVSNSEIKYLKKFPSYGCSFPKCKLTSHNYSIISLKTPFLQLFSTIAGINEQYLKNLENLFIQFAIFYESFLCKVAFCAHCSLKTILFVESQYCLNCSEDVVIRYIISNKVQILTSLG